MAANGTLLCIHRDPTQLSLLAQGGYELLTATNGRDGLRLFMSRPVDAIVLAYQLGLLDGGVVAAAIKGVKPKVPIVMLAEEMEPPEDVLGSVDALVAKSDWPQSLLATIRSVLDPEPVPQGEPERDSHNPFPPVSATRERKRPPPAAHVTGDESAAPFPPKVWRGIRKGTVQF
jgi:DNA-binding response OmpR family regulator